MEKRQDIKNFYIPTDFKAVWEEFIKICKREGSSASEKMREFVARYVAVHSAGNPQLRLESFIGVASKQCFNCEGVVPDLVRVKFVSGLIANICPECLKEKNKHRLVKHVYGSGVEGVGV